MEYTLQLTDEIALQKDDLATYEGAAFTGEEYYLTVPLEHSIHIYGADFTFFTSCTCPHAYAAICYDSINYCFWVKSDISSRCLFRVGFVPVGKKGTE